MDIYLKDNNKGDRNIINDVLLFGIIGWHTMNDRENGKIILILMVMSSPRILFPFMFTVHIFPLLANIFQDLPSV